MLRQIADKRDDGPLELRGDCLVLGIVASVAMLARPDGPASRRRKRCLRMVITSNPTIPSAQLSPSRARSKSAIREKTFSMAC